MQQDKLTTDDWLDLALEQLREHGYGALKAQRLAKLLNVTRGSFYYHFESLAAFHTAVIAHWADRTSTPLIESLGEREAPQTALYELLLTTLRSGEALERAVRSWATVQPEVANAVDDVDRARIGFAQALLQATGVSEDDASTRAQLLYWAAIGRLMMPFPDSHRLTDKAIGDVTALMLTKPRA